MTWQTIDTAPKDGTQVLLYLPGRSPGHRVITGFYFRSERFLNGKSTHLEEGWSAGHLRPPKPEPSHWMPIPAEPED